MTLTTFGKQQAMFIGARAGCFAKSAFLGLVYEKSLKMKNTGTKSIGEV